MFLFRTNMVPFCQLCCSWFFKKPFQLLLSLLVIFLFVNVYFQLTNRSRLYQTVIHTKKDVKETLILQNPTRNNKICNVSFAYGEMCPSLYTELGGNCSYNHGRLECPDIRNKVRTHLRGTQLVITRMLKIFDLIAQKHNITYWITSGTLLGAVRHHGFIPWDEDADVQMSLKDYIKLFKCCRKEFPKDMFFQNSKTDPHQNPSKIKRHPIIGLYKTPWNPRLRDLKSCTRYCLQEGCKWEDGLMIDIFIAEDHLSWIQRAGLFPLQYMTFEGFKFPVPNNWRRILYDFYGDYENDIGGEDERIPQDNSDPFHSCRDLKKQMKRKKKKKRTKRKV